MSKLAVPFIRQTNEWSCGAACLEMIYRFYGETGISQRNIYDALKSKDPHKGGKLQITTDAMVAHANGRGYDARWFRVNLNSGADVEAQISGYLDRDIPLIACQSMADKPLLGHFRIITGKDDTAVLIHDPDPKTGGAFQRRDIQRLIALWQPTGVNVTGGVAIVITKKSTAASAT
jgi:ABC-type bacteriocin/lantibiotic exporter with double-glycine peptidase domain